MPATGSNRTPRRGAALLAVAVGAIHFWLAPEYLHEQAYLGALFIFGAAVLLAAAAGLWSGRRAALAWPTGAVVMAGMFVGFVLSRTIGLPGFHEAEWEGSGILSLVLEVGFLALYARALRHRRAVPAYPVAEALSAERERVGV